MKGYNVCGIQQIGVGVSDIYEAWEWYLTNFGMDCRIFEDETVAELMLPYTGGKPQSRHAALAVNLQSGGGFEIWQYKGRKPQPMDGEVSLGDLGINYCKIKAKDVDLAYKKLSDRGVDIINTPSANPSGERSFFVKDPYHNIFQIVQGNDWLFEEKKATGGAYGAIVGVSNIERALPIYSDILGYDETVYDVTGTFADLEKLPGGDAKVRRVLLKPSKKFAGPFSKLLGQSQIELVCSETPGKKIYANRFWGDPGFIHLCFDIQGMNDLKEYCVKNNSPFTVDSNPNGSSFDMGEAAGHFSYIEDPDGTLIEFVETHKVPILKKLGLYVHLEGKEHGKYLPMWMLKALKFSKVKTTSGLAKK